MSTGDGGISSPTKWACEDIWPSLLPQKQRIAELLQPDENLCSLRRPSQDRRVGQPSPREVYLDLATTTSSSMRTSKSSSSSVSDPEHSSVRRSRWSPPPRPPGLEAPQLVVQPNRRGGLHEEGSTLLRAADSRKPSRTLQLRGVDPRQTLPRWSGFSPCPSPGYTRSRTPIWAGAGQVFEAESLTLPSSSTRLRFSAGLGRWRGRRPCRPGEPVAPRGALLGLDGRPHEWTCCMHRISLSRS